MEIKYSKIIKTKVRDYYTRLYRRELGLKDWLNRVKNRINEEKGEEQRLKQLQFLLGKIFTPGKKCLVIGAGTGGQLWFYLKNLNVKFMELNLMIQP